MNAFGRGVDGEQGLVECGRPVAEIVAVGQLGKDGEVGIVKVFYEGLRAGRRALWGIQRYGIQQRLSG